MIANHVETVNNIMSKTPVNEIRDPSEVFRERLRRARDLREFSQSELANRAGLPASSIAHFEAGGRKPSFDSLRNLADALEVTTDYLLGRSEQIGGSEATDPLFEQANRLSAVDRKLARDFVQMLYQRASITEEG